jgi:hypothetical protein
MSEKSHVLISIVLILCQQQRANSAPSLQCIQDIAAYVAGITPVSPKVWALKSKFASTVISYNANNENYENVHGSV